jgi:hypothetical protein
MFFSRHEAGMRRRALVRIVLCFTLKVREPEPPKRIGFAGTIVRDTVTGLRFEFSDGHERLVGLSSFGCST